MRTIAITFVCVVFAAFSASLHAQATQTAAAAGGENLIRRSAEYASSTQSGKPSLVGDAIRVGGSLAAVLGLIVLMYWGTRRMLPRSALGRSSGAVNVLARTHLSPKQKILVIQVGRRVLVVGDGGSGQLNTLCEIADPDEAAALIGQIHGEHAESTGGRSFASLFGAAKDRLRATTAATASNGKPNPDELDDVELARQQLDGLMQQVRGITRQIDRT